MTVATITTDINIGPFKIPANGQNMIMNNYAFRNKIIIDMVIPEPFMSNALYTVQWVKKDIKIKKIILCSIYQLPSKKKWIEIFVDNMKDVEFHFALEGIKGKGKRFLQNCFKELKIFKQTNLIKEKNNSWSRLYRLKNNKK
jgi:sporadic carbohydrate cluster protein (TIGR04323 family)